MKLVTDISQLEQNIERVENYIAGGSEDEKTAIFNLIRKGKSIVAYEIGNEIRFVPSRFIGYQDISLEKHEANKHLIDGKKTNPAITKVLSSRLEQNDSLEKKFLAYCDSFAEQATAYSKRRYWKFNLKEDFQQNKILDGQFPEGKLVERVHISRERNSKAVIRAKKNFKTKHGRLFCQICKFDFEKEYGETGKDFIEGHHTIAVSDMKPGHKTSPDDIAMLCSNCHRMVHRKRPWLGMDDLKITAIVD